MSVMTGSVRYLFLRGKPRSEDMENWPPTNKPFEGPDNRAGQAVQMSSDTTGWRATLIEEKASSSDEPALLLTRATALGLLHEGSKFQRGKEQVGLLGVRVVNLNGKGVEYVTSLLVHALSSSGLGSGRRIVVAPVSALVISEYVEHGAHALAQLDLRLSPQEYAALPEMLPDAVVQREAQHAIDVAVQNTARFYSYGPHARHGITAEVEAGRVAVYGRVDLTTTGENIHAALLASPGVVEVADHLLYIEQLQEQAQNALEAKGLGAIEVLSEHALIILNGDAPDSATRYKAEETVKRIPGVRGVVNNIVVRAATTA